MSCLEPFSYALSTVTGQSTAGREIEKSDVSVELH